MNEHYMPEALLFLNVKLNDEATRYLLNNSKHPDKSVLFLSCVLTHLSRNSDEVLATLQELADEEGISLKIASVIIKELTRLDVIRCEKVGQLVKYFVNPFFATYMKHAAVRAQAEAFGGPFLGVVDD